MSSSPASTGAAAGRSRPSRLRAPSLTAVAIAAAVVLLTQGALVAHADDLESAPAAASEAVAEGSAALAEEAAEESGEPVVEPVEPVDPTAEEPVEAATEGPVDEPVDIVVRADKIAEPVEASDTAEPTEASTEPLDEALPVADSDAEVAEQAPPASLVENLPVVTEDDYFVIAPGTTLTVAAPGILKNDSDPEKDPFTAQQWGFTTWLGNTGNIGSDGQFGFTPKPGFTGTDTITYYAQDAGHGGTSGTIYVTVQDDVDSSTNHSPDTVPDTYTTPQDEPLGIPSQWGLLANDTDEDGDMITTQALGPIATEQGGSVTIDADGSFYYLPPAGYIGKDYVGYSVYDTFGAGTWGSLIISVTPPGTIPGGPNAAPVAIEDSYFAPVNVPLHIDAVHGVLVNDHDPEGTALSAWTADWGITQNGGAGTVASDGSFIYTPPAGADPQGQDLFGYLATDEAGLSTFASIRIYYTAAVPIVDDPGTDPGTGGPKPGEPHPGDPHPGDPQPGDPQPGEDDPNGGAPTPALPGSPIIATSQTVSSSPDHESLALTGLSLWQPLGGAAAVLLLGALGIVVASRRRRSR